MNVLITGASRGIGRETAKLFARNGHSVIVNYNKSESEALSLVHMLKEQQGCNAFSVKADVADPEQVDNMFKRTAELIGAVDVLVNNAGIAQQKLFCDISEQDFDDMFAVNVKGVFNCCKAVLPDMIRRHSGSIVNISSMWGQTGASCEVHYSASKAAVIGLTKALAKEVGPSGIRVNCICPGVIGTDMNAGLPQDVMEQLKDEIPMGIIGTAADVASAVLFLSGDGAGFMTGQIIGVNGGMVI